MSHARFYAAVALGVALASAGAIAKARRDARVVPRGTSAAHAESRVEREGLAISFALDASPRGTVARFVVTDARSGAPVSGLHLMAWMSARRAGEPPSDDRRCREKIKEHLGGLLSAQAEVDMNSYLLWTLNHDSTISVINPQIAFSKTKTRAVVSLGARGSDWTFTNDDRYAYVSLPTIGQVAVVDGVHYRVAHKLEVGTGPGRVVRSPDEKTVWVGNDGGRTVSVISTDDRKVARTLPAGAGSHDIAFVDEGRWAWLTNEDDDVVHVYDARARTLALQVPVPRGAIAIAASDTARAVYVATRAGDLLVFDAAARRPAAKLALAELTTVRFDRTGRWAVALSKSAGRAWVIDASTAEVRREVDGLASPDSVVFTDAFAYVRSVGSERVTMIELTSVDAIGGAAVVEFVAGQRRPEAAAGVALAPAITATPESGTVVVAQPADRALYVYREGMMAPLGTLLSFGREPLAVAVQDRSLKETSPGVYTAVVSVESDGVHEVELLVDAPRIATCFEETVEGHGPRRAGAAFALRPAFDPSEHLRAGAPSHLAFRIEEEQTGRPFPGDAVDVLFFRPPSQWRGVATRREDGAYHVDVTPRDPGQHTLMIGANTSPALRELHPIALAVDPIGGAP